MTNDFVVNNVTRPACGVRPRRPAVRAARPAFDAMRVVVLLVLLLGQLTLSADSSNVVDADKLRSAVDIAASTGTYTVGRQELNVTVRVGRPISTVLPSFASFTLDSARLCAPDLELPAPDSLAAERLALLADPGLILRFGGTWSDNEQFLAPDKALLPRLHPTPSWLGPGCNLTAKKWTMLERFASRLNASLVFGVNSLTRQNQSDPRSAIDLNNAELLFDQELITRHKHHASQQPLLGFELGNEPSYWMNNATGYTDLPPAQHAADFRAMRARLAAKFTAPMPLIIGPDVVAHASDKRVLHADAYLVDFLAAKPDIDVVSIHFYEFWGSNVSAATMYDEDKLDAAKISAEAARKIVDRALGASTRLWVGEGGPSGTISCSNGCGALTTNLTYEMVHLDMLGSFAAAGVELFARQQLPIPNSVQEKTGVLSPLFWCSMLFKKLMGTTVLNVSTCPARQGVRAYAHSTPRPLLSVGSSREREHGVTLMLLNLNAQPTSVTFRFADSLKPSCLMSKSARKYTIQAGPESRAGSSILLNGNVLKFAGVTTLPSFAGFLVRCDATLLPAHSVTWLVVQ